MTRMKEKYVKEVAPALMEKFQYKSPMQIPKIDKIVVSVGCGDCKDNAKALEAVIKDISAITGQHAVATVAKKSVANFKLREGMKVGVKVTLRQDRMWREGHPPPGPHVGVPGPSVQRGSAPCPRLPRHQR